MRITVVGAGHAGLVAGAGFAAVGHDVRVLDVDAPRIGSLRRGVVPFLEPGLEDLVRTGIGEGRLTFHTDPSVSLADADAAFVCVGTPDDGSGQADLSAVVAAARTVARHAPIGATLVNRSTAPIGTAAFLRDLVSEEGDRSIDVAVNPEFLAEGTAVHDFLQPDRVVVGAWSESAVRVVRAAYESIINGASRSESAESAVPFLVSDPPTAELTKYAANAFLAVKISFINEMACIAEEFGADVTQVAAGIGTDHRIGSAFLQAGVGWGGSCFPKDIAALQGSAEIRGVPTRILRAANDVNSDQHHWVVRKLQANLKTLVGRKVGLLGLSFKALTDDTRHAPSLEIIRLLARLGVRTSVYDPAVKRLPAEVEGRVVLAPDPQTLASGADALVLVTAWPEFRELDLGAMSRSMRMPLLLDGRNALQPEHAREAGFIYVGVGREQQPAWAPRGARADDRLVDAGTHV